MAPTNPVIHEEAEARDCLNDYPEIKLLNRRYIDTPLRQNSCRLKF